MYLILIGEKKMNWSINIEVVENGLIITTGDSGQIQRRIIVGDLREARQFVADECRELFRVLKATQDEYLPRNDKPGDLAERPDNSEQGLNENV
jgi:hypothetical protein